MNDNFSEKDARALSPLTLAFFGDSVYEVLVRERIVKDGSKPIHTLHSMAVKKVNAGFQSYASEKIEDSLTEDELEIFKRGRNATGSNVPRSSNPKDYHRATGLETLFGYLYLSGKHERMNELFDMIYELDTSEN
ncbi:MAG: ribonuclease III [Eubacterium sp.]|nr:ribonuclease III [Eubacterium sp.]